MLEAVSSNLFLTCFPVVSFCFLLLCLIFSAAHSSPLVFLLCQICLNNALRFKLKVRLKNRTRVLENYFIALLLRPIFS